VTIEIHELAIRVTITEQPARAEPDWDGVLQRLKQEILERCREEVLTQLRRTNER
jgi:hypothetical protein